MSRFWNDRRLGIKLAALAAAGAIALAVFALDTVQALRGTGERVDALLAANQATALSPDQIADTIAAVAAATGQTTSAMADAQTAIEEVAQTATTLHSSVSRFRY